MVDHRSPMGVTAAAALVAAFAATAAQAGGDKPKVLSAGDRLVAENVLLYQRETGGWPKNYDRKEKLTAARRAGILKDKSKRDSMIDNGATYTEIRLLADADRQTSDERFAKAALRGIQYLLGLGTIRR